MALFGSGIYLKYNFNKYLPNGFLTHRDNSQAHILLPYSSCFFFSTISTDEAALYSRREDCYFPNLFWLGVNTDSLHLLGESGLIWVNPSFDFLMSWAGKFPRAANHSSPLTEDEETSAIQQPWKPLFQLGPGLLPLHPGHLNYHLQLSKLLPWKNLSNSAILRHGCLISLDELPVHGRLCFSRQAPVRGAGTCW